MIKQELVDDIISGKLILSVDVTVVENPMEFKCFRVSFIQGEDGGFSHDTMFSFSRIPDELRTKLVVDKDAKNITNQCDGIKVVQTYWRIADRWKGTKML